MNIAKILEELGLGRTKGDVYIALLQLGSGTALEVGNKAGIPRTTAHEILQQLLSKGLVSMVAKGRSRTYVAESPEKLKKVLAERQITLERAMPELLLLFNTKGARPRVRYYEGIEGIKTVLEDSLAMQGKLLRTVFSVEDVFKIPGKKFMQELVRRRVEAGIRVHAIRSETKEVEEAWPSSTKENRELHYAPKNMTFSMTIYIYDTKVAIIGTQKENFGMVIESEEFSNTIKNMFDVLWEVTRVAKKAD